jgi:hypothetical protein
MLASAAEFDDIELELQGICEGYMNQQRRTSNLTRH